MRFSEFASQFRPPIRCASGVGERPTHRCGKRTYRCGKRLAPLRPSSRYLGVWLAAWVALGSSTPAHAEDPGGVHRSAAEPGVARGELRCETPASNDAFPAQCRVADPALEIWPWYITVPLLGVALTLELTLRPEKASITGAGPIDDAFRSWVRPTPAGRERAARASDILLYAMAMAPVLDATLWNQQGTRRSRVSYRLLTADSLGFALQSLLVAGTKNIVRRARPYDEGCREDDTYDGGCGSSSRYRSFVSGHASAAFTGASLVCAHQRLRGHSAIGRVECVASLVVASLVGALRMASEKHYFADIVAGAALGFVAGFIVPVFVYPRRLSPPEPTVMNPATAATAASAWW